MAHTRTAWDVTLSKAKREELAAWLSDELTKAEAHRTATDAEVEYWHTLYEQGRTRLGSDTPWADAADLSTPIATEKTDALRSRIVKTVFVDPIVTVEGWGDSASRVPFVEAFHQWQAESSGFQSVFTKAVHLSLIEPRGVLEVYEETARRPQRRRIRAALQLDAEGAALFDERAQPIFERNEDGTYVEVLDEPGQQDEAAARPSADIVIDDWELVASGPRERVIPYKDFYALPGHARERSEEWGYAKRFWRRVDQLEERVEAGIYDRAAVERLGDGDERQGAWNGSGATSLSGEPLDIPQQDGGVAEKELFEVTFLKKLDSTGYRWFVATLHRQSNTLLRLQYDEIGRPRYFSITPFPRADRTEGYSFVGHKLISVCEENISLRNLYMDKAVLQANAPILRRQGALWDPDEQPIGPKQVITVGDMEEVGTLPIPDQTGAIRERLIDTERQAEKLGGMTDIASGTSPNETRTLGETRLVTAFSEVRIEEVVRNVQETVEEIFAVRHLMWVRALRESPDGMDVPTQMLSGMETRGIDATEFMPNKKFTAQLLEGAFRFKPRGSVENADKHQLRRDFSEALKAISVLAQTSPMFGAVLQLPQAAKALLEHWARLYNIPDKQAFIGPEAMMSVARQLMAAEQAKQATAAAMAAMRQMPPPGGPPGLPPRPGGPPPMPPPGPMAPPAGGGAINPPSGMPTNPLAQLPQERTGVQ